MKFFFALCVALIGSAALMMVKAQDPVEPLTFEVGTRVPNDKLLNMYYEESVETATPGQHSVVVDWEYRNINFIRIYVYAVS